MLTIPELITTLFLMVIFSYYSLIFIKRKVPKAHKKLDSITIIIPAHNEEPYLKECIESVIKAKFLGKKEIIVVDDGSIDNTSIIAERYSKKIVLIRQKHSGKSASINHALNIAKGKIIAIVDADSEIELNALEFMANELSRNKVAAATGVIKVKNRKKYVNIFVHIEQLYNSMMRSLLSKVNASVVTPGPLSMYKRKALQEIGGFSTEGFSEDVDVTIRLIRKGYIVGYCQKAVSYTNMPYDFKGFFRQRFRFARGMLNVFKRHITLKKSIIDLYTLPILVFTYIQAVIMGSFTIYQIISGYIQYFYSKGIIFSGEVFEYLLNWTTIIGLLDWIIEIFKGNVTLSAITIIGLVASLLSYPLYFYAIIKFDKKIDIWHLIAIFFIVPFWWLIMIVYILSLPELFRKKQYNIWKKNEK